MRLQFVGSRESGGTAGAPRRSRMGCDARPRALGRAQVRCAARRTSSGATVEPKAERVGGTGPRKRIGAGGASPGRRCSSGKMLVRDLGQLRAEIPARVVVLVVALRANRFRHLLRRHGEG